jgi:hypothetical protein
MFFLFLLFIQFTFAGSICNDGTYSESEGRGTCSWHGGVQDNTFKYNSEDYRLKSNFQKKTEGQAEVTKANAQLDILTGAYTPISLCSQFLPSGRKVSCSLEVYCNGERTAQVFSEEEGNEIWLGKWFKALSYIALKSFTNPDGKTYTKLQEDGSVWVLDDFYTKGAQLTLWKAGTWNFEYGFDWCNRNLR